MKTPIKHLIYCKNWRLKGNNAEKDRERCRKYYKEHKEILKAKVKAYYMDHKEAIAIRLKQKRSDNKLNDKKI